jgi:tetratricopeptide (TPR) repeat protein
MSLYAEKIEPGLIKFKSIYPDKLEGYTLYSDFLVKKNQYEKAGDQLEDAVQSFSTNEIIWEQLISIYSYLGKFERMFEKASMAADSFPENPSFYFYKGLSALQIKKEEVAVESLLKGLPLIKNNRELEVNYYIYLGESYQTIKNYPQSEYYFEKALEMKPDEVFVLNNYSYYLSIRDSKLEYAEKLSGITINAEPDNSTYLDTYAWILYKLERYQDALFYIKKAYEYGGYQNAVIVEHYGDILLKTQNKEEAIKMWELSKNLGNKNIELTNKIELYKQIQHED